MEISSWIYEGILAIETYLLIKYMSSSITNTNESKFRENTFVRHMCYHFVVLTYGVIVVLYMNIHGDWDYLGNTYIYTYFHSVYVVMCRILVLDQNSYESFVFRLYTIMDCDCYHYIL